jgi:hypothetical protein
MEIDRAPDDKWPLTARAFQIPVDVDSSVLFADISEARRAMSKHLAESIFADCRLLDGYKPTPPTWRETLSIYRDRVRDAWAVLLGRAQIGDGW